MAVNVINCGNLALPRSLDVRVNVTKPQIERTTDLSTLVFVQRGGSFEHGANRVAFYSDVDAVNDDSRVTVEGKAAARDFFSQSPRPAQLGIAQAFTTAQAGFIRTGLVGAANISALGAVANGSFAITVDGTSADVTAVDLTGNTTLAQIAADLQTAIRAEGAAFAAVTVAATAAGQLQITSGTTGDLSMVSFLAPVAPATGTDISGTAMLNGLSGSQAAGYTPTGLVGELDLIAEATRCGGRFIYGWTIDRYYRDSDDQLDYASWVQARRAVGIAVSNSPLAWDAGSTTDIGVELRTLGTYKVAPWFASQANAQYYPDVSMLARMLGVDYSARNATITAKFKNLPGIPTEGLSTTQWSVLQSKGYNTFTVTGNNTRMTREGNTADVSWWLDEVVNLDNYSEELEAALFNVFQTNGAVGQDAAGVSLRLAPIAAVSERYTFNGTFAAREVLDTTNPNGFYIDPPYTIDASPLSLQTVADRAARIGTPFSVRVNLRGAVHSTEINVTAYA